MPRSAASSGETSTKLLGVISRMPGDAVGHDALLEVLEQAAVVEVKIVDSALSSSEGGMYSMRMELRLAVGEGELVREEQRRVGAVCGDGPLEDLVAFEALVGDAREERA